MAKPRSRSARIVSESAEDGAVTKFKGQSAVDKAIFLRIHAHRFYLPEQAPVFQGTLRIEFGYQTNMVAGRQVPSEDYKFTEGFSKATRELMEECA